ncbi:NAD(P)-dependent oxidoreductase [Vibrio sp. 2-Bac 85]
MKKILITGHEGLVGSHLMVQLKKAGYLPVGLDIEAKNNDFKGNVIDRDRLKLAMQGCVGIVHLAAVSRVVWGENNPDLCWQTNAEASKQLITLALESDHQPWVMVSSSREVYGESVALPVTEDAELKPVNVYGRAKLAMEEATQFARKQGLQTSIVRLANVYGSIDDHADRVLPAFCRAAVLGEVLRVDGMDHTFDFTHISDTVDGLMRVIDKLDSGEMNLPPIHFLPGLPTTLGEAAYFAIQAANSSSTIQEAPSRSYDVARFVGDATRAKTLLGWEAKITPEQGIALLVNKFQLSVNKEKVVA